MIGLGREQIGTRNIFNEREIAGLFAIFVQHRRQIVEQARAENRDHAGVGIKNRLARSVRARVTERDRRNTDLFSPQQHEFFLIDFGETVNCFAANRSVLGCRRTLGHRAANGTMHLPIALLQLFHRAHGWKNETVFRTNPGAFAVNRLRTGEDDFFDWQIFLANDLEHLGGA